MTKKMKFGLALSSLALTIAVAGCGNKSEAPVSSANTSGGGEAVVNVNGQDIDRNAVRDFLEANTGETAVRRLIDFALISQEAKKQGVDVTEAEVQAVIAQRVAQDPNFGKIKSAGGVRLAALERDTRFQLLRDKLITKDVKADDATVDKWFKAHAKYYDQPERAKLGILVAQTKARADIMADQLKKKDKSFKDLVDEQKKSSDMVGRSSQEELPSLAPVNVLPPAMKAAVAKLKNGETSSVIALGPPTQPVYAIVRLVERTPAVKADFAKMKDQAINDYKLEQVARRLNKENPQNPPFEKTVEQVGAVVQQQAPNGGYRAILDYINQTENAKLLNKLYGEAKVEVKDSAYENVGEEFKQMNAAAGPQAAAAAPPAPAPAAPAPAPAPKQ